jgi:hypothetical protein
MPLRHAEFCHLYECMVYECVYECMYGVWVHGV